MGCGKSTVGRNLAKMTGRKFLDMDNYIEETAGMTIPEIFEQQGESGFRDLEHEACQALASRSGLIVASGGGALTYERNVAVFKGTDTVVLLDVPLETIRQRLMHDPAAAAAAGQGRSDEGALRTASAALSKGSGRHCSRKKHALPDGAGNGAGAEI